MIYFGEHVKKIEDIKEGKKEYDLYHIKKGDGYLCDCCGYITMGEERGSFDICPVCGWEDDDIQFDNPDMAGGANAVSLNQARENFRNFKNHDPKSGFKVRDPLPDEIP